MSLDIEHLRSWIGRTEAMEDFASLAPLRGLAATLDDDDLSPQWSDEILPCWHWLYFLPMQRQGTIGPDGHPQRGGFLPPVPLPRRMWAGSQIEFLSPLRAGQPIARLSSIEDVRAKEGRTGPLVFVRVRHEISADGALSIVERQDLVYRAMALHGEPAPAAEIAPEGSQWSRRIEPDAAFLFRYSALTFNGHRIHYDRTYATDVEGYAGLVVQGPLIATLLLDLVHRHLPAAKIERFAFRAASPLLDNAAFKVCALQADDKTIHLWAESIDGRLAMDATATLA